VSREHIDHQQILSFAEARVNLPKDKADAYREQAGRLGDKLEKYIGEHPDFALRRIMLSGSLAKGTSLRSLSDIDMAVYISGSEAPHDLRQLLEYLAERLRKAFPNFSSDQVKPQTYSVTVSFRGSGLDVDVVPVLYAGKPNWRGDLISQEDGSFLETSIPLHIDFARKRKSANPRHFAQVVRLVKFWSARCKRDDPDFRFKSFMVEMVLAKLSDEGMDFSDYVEALQTFFTYVARTGLRVSKRPPWMPVTQSTRRYARRPRR
jgi:predicted nucleotidyltransferase